MTYNPHLIPGRLEIFCGPMYSGKTQAIIARLDPLKHMNAEFIFFRPECDIRKNRDYGTKAVYVNQNHPEKILDFVEEKHELVAIDEVQFFSKDISKIMEHLLRKGKNVIAAGLDLDFKGEPFGCMPHILPIANEVIKSNSAICRYLENGGICRQMATRTQRLINGKPADYYAPIVSIEGIKTEETYEPRCLKHHFVPGKPKL